MNDSAAEAVGYAMETNRVSLTAIDPKGLGEDFALLYVVTMGSNVPSMIGKLKFKAVNQEQYLKAGYASEREPQFRFLVRNDPYCICFLNQTHRLEFFRAMRDKLITLAKVLGIKRERDDEIDLLF